jgi:hypothetical protein
MTTEGPDQCGCGRSSTCPTRRAPNPHTSLNGFVPLGRTPLREWTQPSGRWRRRTDRHAAIRGLRRLAADAGVRPAPADAPTRLRDRDASRPTSENLDRHPNDILAADCRDPRSGPARGCCCCRAGCVVLRGSRGAGDPEHHGELTGQLPAATDPGAGAHRQRCPRQPGRPVVPGQVAVYGSESGTSRRGSMRVSTAPPPSPRSTLYAATPGRSATASTSSVPS